VSVYLLRSATAGAKCQEVAALALAAEAPGRRRRGQRPRSPRQADGSAGAPDPAEAVRHFLRPRLTAIAPTAAEVVRQAGGWLFDQAMAGWDVTVITTEHPDPRPLRMLGARDRDIQVLRTVPVPGQCLRVPRDSRATPTSRSSTALAAARRVGQRFPDRRLAEMTYEAGLTFLEGPQKRLLISGQWVPSAAGETLPSINPSTGKVIARIAAGDRADADAAVAAARRAFESGPWRSMRPGDRQHVILRLADAVEACYEELHLIEAVDMGMPAGPAPGAGGRAAADVLRYFAGWVTKFGGGTPPNSSRLRRRASSPCGSASCWPGRGYRTAWSTS
jgi:hypothetical protein